MNASLGVKLLIVPIAFPMSFITLSKFFIPITIAFNLIAGNEPLLQENIYLGTLKLIYCLVGSLWVSIWLWKSLGDTSEVAKEV